MTNSTAAIGAAWRLVEELGSIQPGLWFTYLHLILAALFPIYAGSQASLARPTSAAKPAKHAAARDAVEDELAEEQGEEAETEQQMEGLSPWDALTFPLLAGFTLAGLYFILKWLQDPDILNKILNWYFAVFGSFAVARLLSDGMQLALSFVFPARYRSRGLTYQLSSRRRRAVPISPTSGPDSVDSPLPGVWSRLPLGRCGKNGLWIVREYSKRKMDISLRSAVSGSFNFRVDLPDIVAFALSVLMVLYFNLWDKPWWLMNILGFSFSYNVLQLMSPTTFATGTLILTALFFYDIYFVFFTPMMVTVATKLDVPIKLLFPRPSSPDAGPDKRRHAMLGLGDIVLPGIVIGLALRFDLYMFYLRRQRRAVVATKETETGTEVEKAAYISVRSRWAELFWAGTGSRSATAQESLRNEALRFEKPYFHATLVGYVAGMICTLLSMHLSGRGQPALLFLVPGVLFALWGKAWRRGELPEAWAFTEAVEEEGQGKEGSQGKDENSGLGFITSFFSPEKQKKQAAKLEKAITKAVDADKSTAEGGSNNTAQGRRPKEILNLSVSFEPSLYKSECSKLE